MRTVVSCNYLNVNMKYMYMYLLRSLSLFANDLSKERRFLLLVDRVRKETKVMLGEVLALLAGNVDNGVGTLAKLFSSLSVGKREVDDDLVTRSPVGRRGDGVLGGC